jgi:hypothetical protein
MVYHLASRNTLEDGIGAPMRYLLTFLLSLFTLDVALAQNCPGSITSFNSNTSAVASQVNANFQFFLNCVNNNLAPLANPVFTGNLSVGTSGTVSNLFLSGDSALGDNALRLISSDAAGGGFIDVKASTASNGIVFRSNTTNGGTERMRITAGGNVGIGTTAPADLLDASTGIIRANGFRARAGNGGAVTNTFNINWTGAAAQLWIDTVNVGTISTTSDRRLKDDIQPASAGLTRVMDLKPVTFRWRNMDIFHDDGIRHEGFIADEVQPIIPSAVNQRKDEVDGNGHAVYQSLNPQEVIPVLTKAIQEQQGEIEQLRAAVAALQAAK